MRLSFRLVVVALVAVGAARRDRRCEARPRREATDGPAVHEPQQCDQLGSRVLGEARLHRLLHRRWRQPGRYPAARRRPDLRYFESGQPDTREGHPMRLDPERSHHLGSERKRRRRPAPAGRRPDDGRARVRGCQIDESRWEPQPRRPRRLGGRAGLRAERRSGEPVRYGDAGGRRLHGLRGPHDHGLAGVRGGRGQPQAAGLRLVVSAEARPDVRPGYRPTGRQRPPALEDLGGRGAVQRSGELLGDRRAAGQLSRRPRQPDRLV